MHISGIEPKMEQEINKEKTVQLNSACHGIELYAKAWKQEFWSTSTDMPQHHCLDAMAFKQRRIEQQALIATTSLFT